MLNGEVWVPQFAELNGGNRTVGVVELWGGGGRSILVFGFGFTNSGLNLDNLDPFARMQWDGGSPLR